MTKVSVVIVNYNTAHLLGEMFSKLKVAAAVANVQLNCILIDNASRDGSAAVIPQSYPDCTFISNSANVGFGRANNQARPFLTGDYVLLLNTDAFVSADTLAKTIAYMDDHLECGITGVRLVGRNGESQPSARYFPTPWNLFLHRSGLARFFVKTRMVDAPDWDYASPRRCDWVPGCYYLIRRETVDQVGLFDPRYFLYYEEVDHCMAIKKAGWEVVCLPNTTVIHLGGESAKTEGQLSQAGRQLDALRIESELLYFRKNGGRLSVLADLLLMSLADIIIMLKGLVRGERMSQPLSHAWRQSALAWSLFRQTRLATHPTR